jgi:membrane-associated protease RseP (regulator of RpoE activity)
MADNQIPGPIIARLSRVRAIESQLVDRLEQARTAGATDRVRADAARMSALAADHGQSLEGVAGRYGADLGGLEPAIRHRENEQVLSTLLEDAIATAALAIVAYGALYASARLLYENDLCDLADAHAGEWAVELAALNDLLAPAVHAELLSGGLTCRCVCPTCGIGACGCTRNSIDTIREYWGRPGLEPSEGLELRVPPRPGSQLAEAGLERGDRIIAVDGEPVHLNPDIQRALRRHPIGESMTIQVVRGDDLQEIRVARVSDLST